MKIRGQIWLDTDTHLVITLHQPFWTAWKMYGWEEKSEGIGISVEAIEKAIETKRKIRVNVLRYGSYEITPTLAKKYGESFIPRDKKPILVVPRTKFDRIPSKEPERIKKEIYRTNIQGKLL